MSGRVRGGERTGIVVDAQAFEIMGEGFAELKGEIAGRKPLQAAGEIRGCRCHLFRPGAFDRRVVFAFPLVFVTHCTRLGLEVTGTQTVVFEDLHCPGHAADLVVPIRACYRYGKIAIRELMAFHLERLLPEESKKIGYEAGANKEKLEAFYKEWKKFIPDDTVPEKFRPKKDKEK